MHISTRYVVRRVPFNTGAIRCETTKLDNDHMEATVYLNFPDSMPSELAEKIRLRIQQPDEETMS